MKKILIFLSAVLITINLFSQAPKTFSYQAIIRNTEGALIKNQQVGMRISILQGNINSYPIYSSIHTPTTNENGLITLEIGGDATFDAIDWGNGPYFIKTETDPNGSINYTIFGTSQLLTVPYAIYAKTAESLTEPIVESDPVFSEWDKSTGIIISESQISDMQSYLTSEADPSVAENFDFSNAVQGDLLQFDGTKWVKFSPNYLITETDPAFNAWDKSTGINITESQISNLQNYLTTESDPAFNAWDKSTGITITENQISNLQNYLTAESDPAFNAWDKSTGITITESQISNLQNYLTVESDPAFNAWDKSAGISITESQISDLKNYLTAEIDPSVTENFDFSNADSGDILQFNGTKWIKFTPNYLITETDPNSVHLTGDQTIQGDKTFSGNSKFTQDIDADNNTIVNIAEPVNDQDAATKAYVDLLETKLESLKIEFYDYQVLMGNKIKDADGNYYQVIEIGSQTWMTENLKTTKYNDGTSITNASSPTAWQSLANGGYCWYNNDSATYSTNKYGALYNWYTIDQTINGGKNICPAGWHVPTLQEWIDLENYLIANGYNYDGTTTGNKIAKALASTTNWAISSAQGSIGRNDYPAKRNLSRFTAYPAGARMDDGSFLYISTYSYWWSSTESDANNSSFIQLNNGAVGSSKSNNSKNIGLSIRCIKD